MPPSTDTARPPAPSAGAVGAPTGRAGRLLAWWAERQTLAAAAFYAVVAIVFVGQGLLPGRTLSGADFLWSAVPWAAQRPAGVPAVGTNFELADAVVVFEPFFEFARAAFPDLPLWNPHVMGGRPFLANAQSALLSPFTLPSLVLPLAKAYAVMALLKLWVGAFGTYLLGRALGMRFGGALLAGTVFAFGTFFVVWLAWPLPNVFAWLPWLLLATERLVRRPGPLPAVALAVLVGLQFFGGHPETSFHVMLAVVAFFAFRALSLRRASPGAFRLREPVLAFGLALAAGTALAAVTLLPLLELFAHSADYARRQRSEPSHTDPKFIGALFLADFWGRPTQTSLIPFISNRGFYAGAVTLMLAAVALILRPAGIRLAFAAFALFCLAMAVGFEPVFSLVTKLPAFETAHNGRMVVFCLFALAMLAGWGLDDLVRRVPASERRRRAALGAAAALFLVPFVWLLIDGYLRPGRLWPAFEHAWLFADDGPADPRVPVAPEIVARLRVSAFLQWLPPAGAGLALTAAGLFGLRRGRPLAAGALAALAVAILAADLFRANMGFNPAIAVEHAQQPATGAIRYLQGRVPARFAAVDPAAPERVQQPIPADVASRYGLYDARGYDFPVVDRYDRWWRATASPPDEFRPPTSVALPTARALRGMSLLSVADVVQDPADPPLRLPGLRVAYDAPDARVYANARALPRAFLVDRQRTVAGADAALAATLAAGFDARRVAVTERAVPGIAPDAGAAPGRAPGSAALVRQDAERVVARADAARRSLLVLTDVHFPGWKATVDGRPAEVERVDFLLRGVVVPPGRHEVEFRYEPWSWRAGWITSTVAAVALGAVALAALRRRRRA